MQLSITESTKRHITAIIGSISMLIPSLAWDYALIRIVPRLISPLPMPVTAILIVIMLPGALMALVIQLSLPIQLYQAIKTGLIE